jgi:hypothetical protein
MNQLEKLKAWITENKHFKNSVYLYYIDPIELTQEIDRLQSEVCYWKSNNNNTKLYIECLNDDLFETISEKTIFCPYCGKKIKEV